MNIRFALFGALAACAASSSPALAQKVGTYSGTTTDGQGVSFTVTQDANATTLSITSAQIFFNATCRNSTETLNEGEGYGLSTPIVNHQAPIAATFTDFNFVGTVYFVGTTMHGNVTSRAAKLSTANTPPTQSLFCMSPSKTFTGTLQTATPSIMPPAAGNYVYDRKNRVIGVTTPR